MALPDFLIIGAPKAGTTALHAALATHPQLFLSPVKEPKFFLCDGDAPPPGQARTGRRPQRAGVDLAAEPTTRRSSTARRRPRCAARARRSTCTTGPPTPASPAPSRDAKLIVVVRDPVDRAYSNWTHLWSDGLEPIGDFLTACAAEEDRVGGWVGPVLALPAARTLRRAARAPVRRVPPRAGARAALPGRGRAPQESLDAICRFLGVATGLAHTVPAENVHPFVRPSLRTSALSARRSGRGRPPARTLLRSSGGPRRSH